MCTFLASKNYPQSKIRAILSDNATLHARQTRPKRQAKKYVRHIFYDVLRGKKKQRQTRLRSVNLSHSARLPFRKKAAKTRPAAILIAAGPDVY